MKTKFRAWNEESRQMFYEGFHVSAQGVVWEWKDFTATDSVELKYPVTQFIDLLDKNGKEIWEGDILRCKVVMGNEKQYTSDCYYRVDLTICSGVSLYALKMTSEDPSNQYPVVNSPSFRYGSLCTDYRNRNYNRLALEDTYSSNAHQQTRWQNNHYSNDIEVVGNIYETPELIKPTLSSNQL